MKKESKITKFEAMALINWAKEKGLTESEMEALVDVIEATGNETVAIETLLGVYEEIKISKTPKKELRYDNRVLPVFLSFDKFTGKVTYGYCKVSVKHVWKLKTESAPSFDSIEPAMCGYDSSEMAKSLGIERPVFQDLYERVAVTSTPDKTSSLEDTCDLKDWQ
jgi:hypothetical protein